MLRAVGCDHGGTPLNEIIIADLRRLGHEVLDLGTHDATEMDDYPDVAAAVAERVRSGDCERGIVICGSGVGAAVAANKIAGIRAGVCHDTYSAHQGVEHDDMNILSLGGRVVGRELAMELARTFIAARFEGEDRHRRRLDKIRALERQQAK